MPLGTLWTIWLLVEDDRWQRLSLPGIIILHLGTMIAGTLLGILVFTMDDERDLDQRNRR